MSFKHLIDEIMLLAGDYHTLEVNRVSDYGLYLIDKDEEEVLLPNRFVSLENKLGDMIRVFVYHDSEDRIVASTETPTIVVDQVASLKVVDQTPHGAFLDWGLMGKDIFLPNRNMIGRVEVGQPCVVGAYRDNITGRAVVTMALKNFISNDTIVVKPRQQVEILVAQETPLGFRVIVEGKNWGIIYSNQIFTRVEVGDVMTGFVRKITDDDRIDISLQMEGYDQVKDSASKLIELMDKNGGELPIGDNSEPDTIRKITQMSKKVFKRSVGYLLKSGDIDASPSKIRLIKK